MKRNTYLSNPIETIDGIPVFSVRDKYIENYEAIALDHLAAIDSGSKNPFMQARQIEESDRETKQVIRDRVRQGSTILDAGVGIGMLVRGLDEFNCYGVDVALPYLRIAQQEKCEVAMSKLEELPYVDSLFDAVVSCDVFEHVFQLDRAVEQITRVLKKSGLLIVRVPNEELLDSYLTDDQPYSHSHVRGFNLASLRLYLEKCFGFEYVEHRYCSYDFNTGWQIKYKALELESDLRNTIEEITDNVPGSETLKKLLTLNHEEIVDVLITIQNSHPAIFKKLAKDLINPLELIGVFRKR